VARWFCYLLECADGSLYAGITPALERRVRRHNDGSASKYTRARRPVRLVWAEPWPDRSSASRRESEVKRLSRAAKRAVISMGGPEMAPQSPQTLGPPRGTRGGPRDPAAV